MSANIAFALLFIGCAGYVDYRLWWSIRHRAVHVKGWTFKLDDQPGRYWSYFTMNVAAGVLLSALSAIMSYAAVNHS